MALIDDFKARFPEFDTAVVDAKFPFVAAEWGCYNGREYGVDECDDAAILMLCAHLMSLEVSAGNSSGAGTPSRSQQSKSVGSVSVSYDQQTQKGGANFDFFRTTIYGQRYLKMVQKYAVGGYFV